MMSLLLPLFGIGWQPARSDGLELSFDEESLCLVVTLELNYLMHEFVDIVPVLRLR